MQVDIAGTSQKLASVIHKNFSEFQKDRNLRLLFPLMKAAGITVKEQAFITKVFSSLKRAGKIQNWTDITTLQINLVISAAVRNLGSKSIQFCISLQKAYKDLCLSTSPNPIHKIYHDGEYEI